MGFRLKINNKNCIVFYDPFRLDRSFDFNHWYVCVKPEDSQTHANVMILEGDIPHSKIFNNKIRKLVSILVQFEYPDELLPMFKSQDIYNNSVDTIIEDIKKDLNTALGKDK